MTVKKDCPAVEMVQRPVISLEEAKRSRKAWICSKGGRRVSGAGCALLHSIKGANPVLVDMEIDQKHYRVSLLEGQRIEGTKATVKEKRKTERRKRVADRSTKPVSTKPVKRVRFEDEKVSVKDEGFIMPALLLGT